MFCWNCGSELQLNFLKKVSFREVCEKCLASLHCCQGCKYYQIGLPNDCRIPGTEKIVDRSASNFCDEFSILGQAPVKKEGATRKRFDDLFK